MKKFIISGILCFYIFGLAAQENKLPVEKGVLYPYSDNVILEAPENAEATYSPLFKNRSEVSKWRSFHRALSDYLPATPTNYYTLLFPDTITTIYKDSENPGAYTLGVSRTMSAGFSFCPYSDIMFDYGYEELYQDQPYTLDSIGILYNYNRYTADSIVDTLVVNFFHPDKMLYYTDNQIPKGATVRYDVAENKGRDYSHEMKIPLTIDDTATYKWRGQEIMYLGLNNFQVNRASRPVALTFSFRPGYQWNITDTMNTNFDEIPHSPINHFYFWNYTDNTDMEVNEYNNGLIVFYWTNTSETLKPWALSTTYGNLYYRGSSFANSSRYPYVWFKIGYDDEYIGTNEISKNIFLSDPYPNPLNEVLNLKISLNEKAVLDFSIIDPVGRVLKQIPANQFDAGEQNYQISTSYLDQGLYFLRVGSDAFSRLLPFMKTP
jgi:hypothetical protein